MFVISTLLPKTLNKQSKLIGTYMTSDICVYYCMWVDELGLHRAATSTITSELIFIESYVKNIISKLWV